MRGVVDTDTDRSQSVGEEVIKDGGGNSHHDACGGRHEGFGNTGRHDRAVCLDGVTVCERELEAPILLHATYPAAINFGHGPLLEPAAIFNELV